MSYVYPYGSSEGVYFFGIERQKIDNCIQAGNCPIVLIKNFEVLKQIKNDFPNSLTIYLQTTLSGDEFKNKALEIGLQDISLEKRAKRLEKDIEDYTEHCRHKLFDAVVFNDFDMERMVNQLDPITHDKDRENITKNQIFLSISYKPHMDDCYTAIQTACESLSADIKLIRSDKQSGDYKLTEKMIKDIQESSLFICNLTDERPNVYWELGYARGINKKIMTIAKIGTPLHFNTKDFNTEFYQTDIKLQKFLQEEIPKYLSI
jgi:hypothetical protein